ncbi:MAG: hypothetical protein ACLQLG_19315 [Thermoguttaceae bacterium]
MSNAEHIPTHLPQDGATFQPLSYLIGVKFQPPINLLRSKGLEFAAKLSNSVPGFEPQTTELADTQWLFQQKVGVSADGFLRVVTGATEVAIEVGYTDNRLQWFQDRCALILNEFRRTFSPVMVFATTIRMNGTLAIDGDARMFLIRHVTEFDDRRLRIFNRPVQLFGIRLTMPAYQFQPPPKDGQPAAVETVDWLIEAKAESLFVDPRKLFLETLTTWQRPFQWDDSTTNTQIERLEEASTFLQQKFIPCLTSAPKNGEN